MGALLSRILILLARALPASPPHDFTTLHDPTLRPSQTVPVTHIRPDMSPHHHNANDFHHSLNDAYHARLHHPHLCDVRGRRAHSASPARGSPRYRERDWEHELRPGTPASVHSSSSEFGDADIIPPYHPAAPRTLVLCFDGTGDQFDSDVRAVL